MAAREGGGGDGGGEGEGSAGGGEGGGGAREAATRESSSSSLGMPYVGWLVVQRVKYGGGIRTSENAFTNALGGARHKVRSSWRKETPIGATHCRVPAGPRRFVHGTPSAPLESSERRRDEPATTELSTARAVIALCPSGLLTQHLNCLLSCFSIFLPRSLDVAASLLKVLFLVSADSDNRHQVCTYNILPREWLMQRVKRSA